MKAIVRCITVVGLCLALISPALASEKDEHGHGAMGHGEMDHSKMDHSKMDHSEHMGKMVHESTVEGYRFAYHLIDMKEKMEGMKDMKGMKGMSMKGMDMSKMPSHHMMVYIKGPGGEEVADAKVGYKVEGPGGSEQKVMAMAMGGGFGADVDLKTKGIYEIKTKAVTGDKTLLDEFKYEVN